MSSWDADEEPSNNLVEGPAHPEELIPRFQARIDAGVELTFNLLTPDPRQLDLFMKEIPPHLRPRQAAW